VVLSAGYGALQYITPQLQNCTLLAKQRQLINISGIEQLLRTTIQNK
jgi:hypothetical protein